MCGNSTSHGLELVVREVEFLRGFFHNLRNLIIVHMADIREDMVFNLVVQSAGEVIYQPVSRSEIGGCKQLVYCPGVFDFAVFIGLRIGSVFHHVCQLEYDAEDNARSVVHYQEA